MAAHLAGFFLGFQARKRGARLGRQGAPRSTPLRNIAPRSLFCPGPATSPAPPRPRRIRLGAATLRPRFPRPIRALLGWRIRRAAAAATSLPPLEHVAGAREPWRSLSGRQGWPAPLPFHPDGVGLVRIRRQALDASSGVFLPVRLRRVAGSTTEETAMRALRALAVATLMLPLASFPATGAAAADLGGRGRIARGEPAPSYSEESPFSWAGLYVGAHVGYGWSDIDWQEGRSSAATTARAGWPAARSATTCRRAASSMASRPTRPRPGSTAAMPAAGTTSIGSTPCAAGSASRAPTIAGCST